MKEYSGHEVMFPVIELSQRMLKYVIICIIRGAIQPISLMKY